METGWAGASSSPDFGSGIILHHARCDFASAGAGAAATALDDAGTGATGKANFFAGMTAALGDGGAPEGTGAPTVGTGGLSPCAAVVEFELAEAGVAAVGDAVGDAVEAALGAAAGAGLV